METECFEWGGYPVSFSEENFTISGKCYPFLSVNSFEARRRWIFWRSFIVTYTYNGILCTDKYNGSAAGLKDFIQKITSFYNLGLAKRLAEYANKVTFNDDIIKELLNRECYLRSSMVATMKSRLHTKPEALLSDDLFSTAMFHKYASVQNHALYETLSSQIKTLKQNMDTDIQIHNEVYCKKEIEKYASLFDSVEKHPLTEEQRLACVCDADTNLVIAGAGTGKTSVVIGKVSYLLHKGVCAPEDILIMAFNRKAAEEIKERIRVRISDEISQRVNVHTFHSFGLDVISDAEAARPSVSKFCENEYALMKFVDDSIKAMLSDNTYSKLIGDYFAYYLDPADKTEFDFNTKAEYSSYMKNYPQITLKGMVNSGVADMLTLRKEKVKSRQECRIANFLFLNGVNYEYEKPYKYVWGDQHHSQYKPDFYLTDYDIYLEHFGIKRDGSTAPYINSVEYNRQILLKREQHQIHHTVMIETYSWEHFEGTWETDLASKLRVAGVELHPLSGDSLKNVMFNCGQAINRLGKLLITFLNLFESADTTVTNVKTLALSRPDVKRTFAFLDIFEEFFNRYKNALADEPAIDFHQMITYGANLVTSGRAPRNFKYIIVDEYQDIALDRQGLLKAVYSASDNPSLVCVGDDWQSIYRFTGSDVSLMSRFQNYWSGTAIMLLSQTFRFPQPLLEVSSKFVQKCPSQIKKTLTSFFKGETPCVHIVYQGSGYSSYTTFETMYDEITTETGGQKASVYILGRYRKSKPIFLSELVKKYPSIQTDFLTVHRSKGLEADYIIILDNKCGNNGFPCTITDDPIIDLMLSQSDDFEFAEERRLFYVALTRARKKVFLCVPPNNESPFIKELLEMTELIEIDKPDGADEQSGHEEVGEESASCPKCKKGHLVLRTGRYGPFFGCSSYPECQYTENVKKGNKNSINKEKGKVTTKIPPASDSIFNEVCWMEIEQRLYKNQISLDSDLYAAIKCFILGGFFQKDDNRFVITNPSAVFRVAKDGRNGRRAWGVNYYAQIDTIVLPNKNTEIILTGGLIRKGESQGVGEIRIKTITGKALDLRDFCLRSM